MTEREKIIDILNKNFTQEVECTPVYTTTDGKEIELPQELCDIFNDIVLHRQLFRILPTRLLRQELEMWVKRKKN